MRGLFIGRFQPLHNGHTTIIEHALKEVDSVIVGIGSAESSYLPSDPFTAAERMEMLIKASVELGWTGRIVPVPIRDVNRYSIWVSHVESLCPKFDIVYSNNPLTVRLFRKAGYTVRSTPLQDRSRLSGVSIREMMLEGDDWRLLVPPSVAEVIDEVDGVGRLREITARGGAV